MTEPTPTVRFEVALAELEKILRELEDGTTSLEDALARYERGVGILKACYGQLRDAEQRIRQLTGVGEDGSPEFKAFEHSASVEVTKPQRRAKPSADDLYG